MRYNSCRYNRWDDFNAETINVVSDEKFIMLIDDDMDDRYLFSRAAQLQDPEIKCVTVEGGQQAFELLNKMPHLPAVIFLDLNMPGMDGWGFLRQLHEIDRFKKLPILIYSTSSHEKDIMEAQTAGAIGYCVKPLAFDGLQSILHFVCTNLGPGLGEAIKNNKGIAYFRPLVNQP
jgi:CheY-like chemotaxis protein